MNSDEWESGCHQTKHVCQWSLVVEYRSLFIVMIYCTTGIGLHVVYLAAVCSVCDRSCVLNTDCDKTGGCVCMRVWETVHDMCRAVTLCIS